MSFGNGVLARPTCSSLIQVEKGAIFTQPAGDVDAAKSRSLFSYQRALLLSSRQRSIRHVLRRIETRARLAVDEHTLTTVQRKGNDERSIVLAAPPRSIQVTFTMERRCEFGEHYAVVGEVDELRLWDPTNAVVAQWSEGHHWKVAVELPGDRSIEFKFVLLGRHGEIWWQPGRNHVLAMAGLARSVDVYVPWDTEQPLVVVNHPENSTSDWSLNGSFTEFNVQEAEAELVADDDSTSRGVMMNGRSSPSVILNGYVDSDMESFNYSDSRMESNGYSNSGMEANGYSNSSIEFHHYFHSHTEANGYSHRSVESASLTASDSIVNGSEIGGFDSVSPAQENQAVPLMAKTVNGASGGSVHSGAARDEQFYKLGGSSPAEAEEESFMKEQRKVAAESMGAKSSTRSAGFNAARTFPTKMDSGKFKGVDEDGEAALEYVPASSGQRMFADMAGSVGAAYEAVFAEHNEDEVDSSVVLSKASASGSGSKAQQHTTGGRVKTSQKMGRQRKSNSKYLSELFFNDAHVPLRRWAGELYLDNPSSTPTATSPFASPALRSTASPTPSSSKQTAEAFMPSASHGSLPLNLTTSGVPASPHFDPRPTSGSSLTATLAPPAPSPFEGLGELVERGLGRLFSRMQHSVTRARMWMILIPLPVLSTPLAALVVAVQLFLLLSLLS